MISGRIALIIITVTTATGGFTLGYLVGRNAPSSDVSIIPGRSAGDGASATNLQIPSTGGSDALSHGNSVEQPLPSGDKSAPSTSASLETSRKGEELSKRVSLPEKVQDFSDTEDKSGSGRKGIPGEKSTASPSRPDDRSSKASVPPGTGNYEAGSHGTAVSPLKKSVYIIQAGAFKHRKDADALRRRLEAKGYKASVRKDAGPAGATLFKVQAGEFGTKKEAMAAVREFRESEKLDALVIAANTKERTR